MRSELTLQIGSILPDGRSVRIGSIRVIVYSGTLPLRLIVAAVVNDPVLDDKALVAHCIDLPAAASENDEILEVAGWVIGRSAPALAVEVIHEDVVLAHIPVGVHRPDVAAVFPDAPGAEHAGFRGMVDLRPTLAGLPKVPVDATTQPENRLPLPPGPLLNLVAGTTNVEWFLTSGQRAAESIRGSLDLIGRPLESFATVLDWGCGCGRVIRHFADTLGPRFFGCDYNPELVDWSRGAYPHAHFEVNGLLPPLPFPAGSFDLVYGLSVLTHLPEAIQSAWMAELARVVQPGGVALLTIHGAHYLEVLSVEEQEVFRAGQLVVRDGDQAGTNYCGAFCSESYVRSQLAAQHGFEVLLFEPEGAKGNPFQDLYLLERRESRE